MYIARHLELFTCYLVSVAPIMLGKQRLFWLRIWKHIYNIKSWDLSTPVARHVAPYHTYNSKVVQFCALDHQILILGVHSCVRLRPGGYTH